MRLLSSQPGAWKYTLLGISKIIREAALKADDTGIRLKAMDVSHVAMVDLFFPANFFEEYDANSEVIGLDLEAFGEILKRARKNDKLEMIFEKGKLSVNYIGNFKRTFVESTIDVPFTDLPEPRIEFKAEVRLLSNILKDSISDIEFLGDAIIFRAKDNSFSLINESEVGSAEVTIDQETGGLISISTDGEQKAMYGLDYIESLLKAAEVAEIVVLQFSNDMPLKMTFELPQGARLVSYIAPRTI